MTGTGFRSAAGANNKVGVVEFQTTTACASTSGTGTAVTVKNVVSATSLVITTPLLAAVASGVPKAYVLCVYTTTPALLGQAAVYTVYSAPTVLPTSASLTKGLSSGGQAVAIDGTNFTAKSTVTVGGVAATASSTPRPPR